MKPIQAEDRILYFEERTGFLYEKKEFGGIYYVPLNFCILDKNNKIDKPVKTKSNGSKTIQKHPGHLQLRRQQERRVGSGKLQSQTGMRVGASRWNKISCNQSTDGIGSLHKFKRKNRRDGVHHILGASSTVNIHGIRSHIGTKNGKIEKII